MHGLIFDVFCQDTLNIAKVLNKASSSWGPVFLLQAAWYFCRSQHFLFNDMQWIKIVYGFLCAGRWFNRKFPDYFCCHLYQISAYVLTVDSIISIFTFYFLFWALTLESQSDCFVVLSCRFYYRTKRMPEQRQTRTPAKRGCCSRHCRACLCRRRAGRRRCSCCCPRRRRGACCFCTCPQPCQKGGWIG